MSRLERWLDEEVRLAGPMGQQEESEYREALSGTLIAAQLRVADAAGDLGDAVLTALRSHTERVRNSRLREWFRRDV